MKKKNSYIELQRFICCTLIFMYHTGLCENAWIATEFFFVLAGYFLYKTSFKEISIDKILLNKVKSVFPYTTVTILGMYVLNIVVKKLGFHDILRFSTRILGDIFLLNGTGFIPKNLVVSENYLIEVMPCSWLWFLTSMFFCMPIVLYLFRKHRDKIMWTSSLFALSLYGVLLSQHDTINGFQSFYTVLFCNIRAMAGLLLGAFVYILKDKILEYNEKANKSALFFIAEIVMFVGFIGLCFTEIPSKETLQIPLIVLMLAVSFSGVTVTSKLDNKVINFLGSISLPVYVYHTLIYTLISVININTGLETGIIKAISYIATIAVSSISVIVVGKIAKK